MRIINKQSFDKEASIGKEIPRTLRELTV